MSIRYIIVVKLIKPVIAHPTDRKEGLRPVRSPKSFSEAPSPSTISFYVNSVYNSSEIDKIRYCQPNRWTEKGGPTACVTTCPENLHRPGLIRPTGSQGQSRIIGLIGSISRSIADTRYIIVVKLIKSVIANSTDRKEGLRPLSPPYNEKIISIYDDRIVNRTGSENDFGPYLSQAYNEK